MSPSSRLATPLLGYFQYMGVDHRGAHILGLGRKAVWLRGRLCPMPILYVLPSGIKRIRHDGLLASPLDKSDWCKRGRRWDAGGGG